MNITHSRHNWEAGHYGRLSSLCDEMRDLLSSDSPRVERIHELDEILYVLDPDELERIWLEKEYSDEAH